MPARFSTLNRIWRVLDYVRTLLLLFTVARLVLRIRRRGLLSTLLPAIRPLVNVQLRRTINAIEHELITEPAEPSRLPPTGWSWVHVRRELRRLRMTSKYERASLGMDKTGVDYVKDGTVAGSGGGDKVVEGYEGGVEIGPPLAGGKVSGAIYFAYPPLFQEHVLMYAMNQFLWANPLHADLFPGLRTIEASTVAMTGNLFHAPVPDCGNISSGGTESIMLACKCYRDLWYHRLAQYDCDPSQAFAARPALAKLVESPAESTVTPSAIPPPEMLVPKSAHPAFDKSAQYLNMRLKHVPLDPFTGKVDIQAMHSAINEYTCMIVVSAPNFPHGIIDDVDKAAEIAEKYQIPLHVDACLGSFVLPFNKEIKPVDFRVPAVTSMTMDTHKYGYSPKGTSVVLYRWNGLRRFQYFRTTGWPGGIYGSPSIAGSRNGSVIAGTWAVMVSLGEKGYRECAERLLDCAKFVTNELRQIDHIKVIGDPQMTVVAFTSESPINIYVLSDMLSSQYNWNLNILQHPAAIHIAITMNSLIDARKLPAEVWECVDKLMSMPVEKRKELEKKGGAAMYGTAAALPQGLGETVFEEVTNGFLDALTKTKAGR